MTHKCQFADGSSSNNILETIKGHRTGSKIKSANSEGSEYQVTFVFSIGQLSVRKAII